MRAITALCFLAFSGGLAVAEPADKAEPVLEDLLVAGGCFWCVEADLEKVDGIFDVVSGYAGGRNANPTYQNYSSNGHREVALVKYDPDTISFDEVMAFFIRTIDVTDDGGQFCDRGYGYSTAVYYGTEAERVSLERIIAEGEEEIGREIVTPIEAEPTFYPAEDYHQDYYMKNPRRYGVYRGLCGRDRTVRGVWGQSAGELISGRKKTTAVSTKRNG
ncbi:MAG: peptide-methionine (S)-S-oxide reductase MsrA [Pseudomonadota bacterium]